MHYQMNFARRLPSAPKPKARFFERQLDLAAEKQMHLLARKRKLLSRIGIHEDKIIEKVGIKRSFAIAKFGSHIDIVVEIVNFAVPFAAVAAIAVPAINCFSEIMNLAHTSMNADQAAAATQELFQKFYAPALRNIFIVLPAVAIASKALTCVGNFLDVFQHVFLESLASRFDGEIKPKMQELYREFSKVSLLELAGDVVLSFIPLPFIETFRRLRAIKYERMQLDTIRKMEQLHKENASPLPTSVSP